MCHGRSNIFCHLHNNFCSVPPSNSISYVFIILYANFLANPLNSLVQNHVLFFNNLSNFAFLSNGWGIVRQRQYHVLGPKFALQRKIPPVPTKFYRLVYFHLILSDDRRTFYSNLLLWILMKKTFRISSPRWTAMTHNDRLLVMCFIMKIGILYNNSSGFYGGLPHSENIEAS